jgi:putative FmdB family regulatory protein
MPIFEYRCQECGDIFEVLTLRAGQQEAPVCRKCGSAATERVLSSFAGSVGDGVGCGSGAGGGG